MDINQITAAMQAVLDEAGDASLTDEQVERYEELEGQLKRAQKTAEIQARNAAYNSVVTSAVHVSGSSKQDDTLERAFNHYLRTGKENADITELRAQGVGTDTAGGFLVPDTLLNKMVERKVSFGGVASEAETVTTAKGEPMRFPTIDDTANSGAITAEGSAPSAGGADLVFGEKVLGAFTYTSNGASNLPLRVSHELLQDANWNVQDKVTSVLATRIGRKQANDWVQGTGTTLPFGLVTGTDGTAFTTAAPTYAALVTAKHEVDEAYRENAVWTFKDSTLALLEQLVDGNGRPLLQHSYDGIAGKPALTLLGHRIVIDNAWDAYTDNTTNEWGAFGDLKQGYLIRRVKDVTLLADPYSRLNERQVQFTMYARADGVVQNPHAFRVLINAAD